MKWLKIGKETKTNWDVLVDLWIRLEEIEYHLDSPEWYWMKHEWNRFTIDRVATQASIRRVSKVVDGEEYPSCICSS